MSCCAACALAALGCAESAREVNENARNYAQAPARAPVPSEAAPEAEAPARATQQRKVIYNARVELVVESVASTGDTLARLVKQSGGYLSETDVQSHAQWPREATWKVRIPVDHFDAFLADVIRLGELRKSHLDSQDVTQEYYDLEARISNKQEEEKRLLKHLADSTGKLEDILAVERELSRVRGEIEQMQGRIRFLANQTALSTITIVATELRDYVAPVTPSFHTQIIRTFQQSIAALAGFGKAVVLLVVAVAPWLPVLLVVAVPLGWLLRRRRSARAGFEPNRPERLRA
jgi:hypothetical protein